MSLGAYILKLESRNRERKALSLGLIPKNISLQKSDTIINCWVPDPASSAYDASKPVLMLVHGFALDGISGWDNQLSDLATHFALYIPDLVFFGGSTTKSEQRSEYFQALCMLEVLEKEGVSEAAVVGTSYGGFVAFRMAELDPTRVKKVVIASSGVCMDPSSNDATLAEFRVKHIHQVLMPLSVRVQRKSINYCMFKPLPFFIFNCLLLAAMKMYGGNRKEKIELLEGLRIGKADAPLLPKLSQEVLILTGSHDKIFALDLAKKLKEHLGETATLEVIGETGHVPQLEKPKDFNKHVLAFLKV